MGLGPVVRIADLLQSEENNPQYQAIHHRLYAYNLDLRCAESKQKFTQLAPSELIEHRIGGNSRGAF